MPEINELCERCHRTIGWSTLNSVSIFRHESWPGGREQEYKTINLTLCKKCMGELKLFLSGLIYIDHEERTIHHADGALECTHVSVSCHAPWPPREEASTDWSYVTCRACLATINQKDDELDELKEELNAERAELEGIKVQQFMRDVQAAQDYRNRNETIS